MTPDRDTTRIVRSWLETGATDLPDRVLDKVLDQLPATPQRRRWWQARRFSHMNSAFKVGTAAAAAVLIGVVGINLLPGTAGTGVGAPAPSVSPSPSPHPSPASRPIPSGEMAAGRYHIDVALHQYPAGDDGTATPLPFGLARISFDAPAGWTGEGGWLIIKNEDTQSEVAMAPFTIDRVYLDPCHSAGAEDRGDATDPLLARSLDGLAEAFSAGWSAETRFAPTSPLASKPASTTFAGLDARYLTVRQPDDLDVASCDEGEYRLWLEPRGDKRWSSAGERNQLWIVDAADGAVPGGVLVIDAASYPDSSPTDVAELQAIVDSIEIELLSGS